MFNKYIIKDGDSLESIANRYNYDLTELQNVNKIYYEGELRAGSEIILPTDDKYYNIYVIEKGDSIYGIARKYNINPSLLAAMNGLKNEDYIYPGQELIIPKSGYSYYLTAEGDTLDMVAKAFNKRKDVLIEENKTIYLLPEQLIISKK